MGKVDPDDPRPPYQQLADELRSAIGGGEYSPGERLPRQAEIADEYRVSVGTVKSALKVLREEGLIVSRQGEGSWVHSRPIERESSPAGDAEAGGSGDADLHRVLSGVLDRLTAIENRLAEISGK
ncbi:GntR family transcriptional regulator [Actinopolyspora mortivallis]|uniref:GntR family transcriptional regulator n=1 Tax=Actinopolyspora mortivallis TaxID=33906 RepID=A0A2T0GRF4_ACTMO|nr:GntR family transcriptional regulator [Actinopolyspora mortivallis]